MKYLKHIDSIGKRDKVGEKARSLRFLQRRRFRIPPTYVLSANAMFGFRKDPEAVMLKIRNELRELINPGIRYAIRSSAEEEDNPDYSYAGQFKTVLNVRGVDPVLDGIQEVWHSVEEVQRSSYRMGIQDDKPELEMAVIIQEMVDSRWAGVAFSINPVNGRDEVIIEAVKGSGEQLVQEGKDPIRWVFSHGSWEGNRQKDSPGEKVLDEILEGVLQLRKASGSEIDLEWAADDQDLYFLQKRAVTVRKYPTIYSNHISREFLPGMIKPLVWSVNIPLVNSAWIRLMEEFLGPLDISPDQLSKSFYYRAYFNMGTMGELFHLMGFPRNSLEYLMGRKDPSGKNPFRPGLKTMRYLPRMVRSVISKLSLGRELRQWMKSQESETERLKELLASAFDPMEFEPLYRRVLLHTESAAYYNIVIPLIMHLFNRRLNKKLRRHGISLEALDFYRDFPMLKEHDPQFKIRNLNRIWNDLPEKERTGTLTYSDIENLPESETLEQFRSEFSALLKEFGHFSESGNDFSYPHWREDPDFVFRLVINAGSTRVGKKNENHSAVQSLPKNLRIHYRRAGRFRLYREMVSSEYTREYGMFRSLFARSGHYLFQNGSLEHPDDLYFLHLEELNALLKDPAAPLKKRLLARIEKRKKEMVEYSDISLPGVIYGEDTPPIPRENERTLQGIPTSPGNFEGKIVVVRGYEDFEKEVEGAILVIPYADVGWTPILHRAGAIVSESGGMLSHASIVARELSIPSISSVDRACKLEDGITGTVDGTNGILIINNT